MSAKNKYRIAYINNRPYLVNMVLKPFVTLLFSLFVWTLTIGQTTLQPRQLGAASKGVVYKDEFGVNFTLHTNGFRLGFDKGKIKTYYKTTYYHFDFGYIRHPKEIRQSLSYQSNLDVNTSFVYGKQNSFFVFRGGFGNKRYYSEKAKKKGIAVGVNYEYGATLGMLKPYYLVFSQRVDGQRIIFEEKYRSSFEEIFLDETKIQGRAGFFKGFDEVKFVPGIHGKGGVHFALGAFDQYVTAIEVGVMIDIFLKSVPIMVVENNNPYFFNLYLTLQIGKRS